jgi:hypothetical protein
MPPAPSTDTLFTDIRQLIYQARQTAFQQINQLQVITNFEIGRRIVEHDQYGEERAEYGKAVLKALSEKLTHEFGRGFSVQNLYAMRGFYLTYQEIVAQKFQAVPGKLRSDILKEKFPLSWTHYLVLMGLKNTEERQFYEIETQTNNWSTRELERQINASLFERLALNRDTTKVKQLATHGQIIQHPGDVIKDPYILEFLGLEENCAAMF